MENSVGRNTKLVKIYVIGLRGSEIKMIISINRVCYPTENAFKGNMDQMEIGRLCPKSSKFEYGRKHLIPSEKNIG